MQHPPYNRVKRGDTLYVAVFTDVHGEQSVDFATCRESFEDCCRAMRVQYRRHGEYTSIMAIKVLMMTEEVVR